MTDERTIEARIYERLSKVIDPELGRSVTDLGMIAAIDAIPVEGKANTYEVRVEVELTGGRLSTVADYHQPDQRSGVVISGSDIAAAHRSRVHEPRQAHPTCGRPQGRT